LKCWWDTVPTENQVQIVNGGPITLVTAIINEFVGNLTDKKKEKQALFLSQHICDISLC
jgi:hypothetical protein